MCYQEKRLPSSLTAVLLTKKIQNICVATSGEKLKRLFWRVGARTFSNYAESENQKGTLFVNFIVRTFSLTLY